MHKYIFAFKRFLFWQQREIVGHKLEDNNTMVLYFSNGGIETIPNWNNYKMKLGADWALSVKKNMETQTGVDVKVNIGD